MNQKTSQLKNFQIYINKHLYLHRKLVCVGGFCCGDGWEKIIYNLSKKITELDPNVEAVQVKEKFGGLRFYIGPVIQDKADKVYEAISEAESESFKTCEYCGTKENVTTKGPGWIKTLCNDCRKERSKKIE